MSLPDEPPPVDPDAAAMPPPPESVPTAMAIPDLRPRPMIERVGMAAIALVVAAIFVLVSAAAFIGGGPFLGLIGAAGVRLGGWVGGLTRLRG